MTITPEAKREIIERLARRDAERLKESLLTALDTGWLTFSRGKPQQRLAAYLSNTLEADRALVSDPDYLDKLSKGEAPMLLAVQIMQAKAAGQMPEQPDPPALWPIVISRLPGVVYEKLSRDFRGLLRDEERKNAA